MTLIPQIAQSIRQQLQSYAGAVVEDGVETGDVEKEQEEYEGVDDLRVVIKLDIHCGPLHLKDRFEWPLLKTHSITPEDFAKQLTAELGIGGEFVSLIAHSIREQVCYARLNFDETMAAPSWATMAHPPFRNENDESFWEPELKELDSEELEKIRKEQERNARYVGDFLFLGSYYLLHFSLTKCLSNISTDVCVVQHVPDLTPDPASPPPNPTNTTNNLSCNNNPCNNSNKTVNNP